MKNLQNNTIKGNTISISRMETIAQEITTRLDYDQFYFLMGLIEKQANIKIIVIPSKEVQQ